MSDSHLHPDVRPIRNAETSKSYTELDWKAYFREFWELHGGFGLVHRGRILFRDGWSYSESSHKGPEWPPPEDEAEYLELVRDYWRLRKLAVNRQLIEEREKVRKLKELKTTKSAKLQQRTVIVGTDPDTGRATRTVIRNEFDEFAMDERVRLLEEDLKTAEDEVVTADLELKLLRLEAGNATDSLDGVGVAAWA